MHAVQAEESCQLWEAVIAGFPEGVVLAREGEIRYANAVLAACLGYAGGEGLQGQRLDRWVRAAGPPPLAGPQEGWGRRRDGSEFPLEYSLACLDVDEEPWQVLVVRDVSERKRLERQYRDAQKMQVVGRLVGGIVHDFNNLLTAVMIYAGMLLTRLREGGRQHHYALEIQRASERGAALAAQLLALARQQPLNPEEIDLDGFLHSRRELLQRLVGERITCRIECGPRLFRVRMDAAQLDQVLLNLTANARDAMTEGGQLAIGAANREVTPCFARSHLGLLPGHYVVLSVRDTGCGMDEKTRAHLFEPFFTTKERGKGTGLGLTTVYGILAQAGGRIYVESEPGKGTEVRIFLPAVGAVNSRVGEPVPYVLLVDDDELVRESLAAMLENAGIRVLPACDGPQALRLAGEHATCLAAVVTDVVMPGMSGTELAEELRALVPELPVIYMSGYSAEAQLEKLRAGGAPCLQKPFVPQVLVDAVAEALGRAVGAGA